MTPSAEQRDFAASLHELLAAVDAPSLARAWGRGEHPSGLALWQRLAKLGVTALAIPLAHDGLGASPMDLVVAFEELGHHAVPGPLVESIAVAPHLAPPQWLPRLASGEVIATVGPHFLDADIADLILGGEPGPLTVTLDRSRRLFPASQKAATPNALSAPNALIAPADLKAAEALRAEPGAKAAAAERLSAEPSLMAAEAEGLSAATGGLSAEAFDAGALACAAQLLGLGRAMLEMSVSYAKARVQFGQPIGRFQATKHGLAEVLIALDFARPLLYAAAASAAKRDVSAAAASTAARDISAAKVACGDAAYLAARRALQVHGAIGYTEEFDLSIWFTKVRALVSAWGTPAEHRARVMAAL